MAVQTGKACSHIPGQPGALRQRQGCHPTHDTSRNHKNDSGTIHFKGDQSRSVALRKSIWTMMHFCHMELLITILTRCRVPVLNTAPHQVRSELHIIQDRDKQLDGEDNLHLQNAPRQTLLCTHAHILSKSRR